MPGINRFYKPTQSSYQSQFVPDKLPADLMLKALGNQQQKYNKMDANMTEFGKWKQASLTGEDTRFVEGKQQDLTEFIDGASTKDLGSQEFAREYQSFKKDFLGDKGIAKVQGAVDTHTSYQERIKEPKEGDSTDYDPAFADDYLRRYNEYTSEDGQGYKGDTLLGDASILSGVDENKETKEYFNTLKADGRESIKYLSQGLSYKNGWVGVKGTKVDAQAARVLDTYYDSRVGEQLQAKFDENYIPKEFASHDAFYQSLSQEEATAHQAAKKQFVASRLANVGKGFVYQTNTTNQDVAINKQVGRDDESALLNPQQLNLSVQGNTIYVENPSFAEATETFEANSQALTEHTEVKNEFSMLQRGVLDGSLKRNADGVLILTDKTLKLLEGIPGTKAFINGDPLTDVETADLAATLGNKVEDHKFQIAGIKEQQTVIGQQTVEAAAEYNGNITYGQHNATLMEALDLGNTIDKVGGAPAQVKAELELMMADNEDWGTAFDEGKAADLKALSDKYGGMDNLTSGKVSPEQKAQYQAEVTNLSNQYRNLKTWATAQDDYTSTMQEVGSGTWETQDFMNIYNSKKSFQPKADVINRDQTKYAQRDVNEFGEVVTSKQQTWTADLQMENLYNTNSNSFILRIGSERITEGDYRYQSALEFASANKSPHNGHPIFNASADVEYTDPFTGVKSTKTLNYTIEAESLANTDAYWAAKSDEAKSNILADANYDPSVSMVNQQNLSTQGQQSLINYTTYGDPEMAEQMTQVSSLKSPGSQTFFTRPGWSPVSGKVEPINYNVKKSGSSEGGLVIEATDQNGNSMYGKIGAQTVPNAAAVSGTIFDLERELELREGMYQAGEIGLSAPAKHQSTFTEDGVFKGTTELESQAVSHDVGESQKKHVVAKTSQVMSKMLNNSYLFNKANPKYGDTSNLKYEKK